MHKANWGYLATITGIDLGIEAGQIELLYHFCQHSDGHAARARPTTMRFVPGLEIIPSVSFYQARTDGMLGVTIVNTPSTALPAG